MNVQNVRWILSREIRDQLRDRRTLFVVLVLPILLYPLLGMTFFQISQFMQEQSIRVLVVGARDPVGLPPLFEDDRFALELFTDPAKIGLIEVEFASVEPRQRDEAASLLVYSQEQARSAVIATDSPAQVEAYADPFFLIGTPDYARMVALSAIATGAQPGRTSATQHPRKPAPLNRAPYTPSVRFRISYRVVSSGEPVSQLWMLEAPLAKQSRPKESMSPLRQASAPCSTRSNSL
mgnify:CR=1 FL=1